MWCLQRMLKTSWTQLVPATEVLRRAEYGRGRFQTIKEGQNRLHGHMMRKKMKWNARCSSAQMSNAEEDQEETSLNICKIAQKLHQNWRWLSLKRSLAWPWLATGHGHPSVKHMAIYDDDGRVSPSWEHELVELAKWGSKIAQDCWKIILSHWRYFHQWPKKTKNLCPYKSYDIWKWPINSNILDQNVHELHSLILTVIQSFGANWYCHCFRKIEVCATKHYSLDNWKSFLDSALFYLACITSY